MSVIWLAAEGGLHWKVFQFPICLFQNKKSKKAPYFNFAFYTYKI